MLFVLSNKRSEISQKKNGKNVQAHFLAVLVFLVLLRLSYRFSISSEDSASNLTPEVALSSSGSSESLKTPSGPSLSSSPRTPEKEAQGDGDAEVTPEGETEEEKAVRLLYCSLCKVAVNSASQLQAHNNGKGMLLAASSSSRFSWV